MEANKQKFNIYVFLSTFARALIETFIPLLLFKFGYNNYNLMYEFICKVFRGIVLIISYLFINDLRIMIYLSVAVILFGLIFSIKKVRKKRF